MSGFRFHCAKLKGCSKNAASISAMKRFAPGGTGSARGSRRRSASSAFIINHFHPGDGTSTRFSCASMANCATSGGRPVGRVVEGEVLESFVTKRRNRKAALTFLRKAMKRYGCPKVVVTDRLRSYRAAMEVIGNAERQKTGRWLNNRAENSHQPFRRRERAMAKFRSAKSLQKFVSIHSSVHNHFNHERHLRSRQIFKLNRLLALAEWRQLAA